MEHDEQDGRYIVFLEEDERGGFIYRLSFLIIYWDYITAHATIHLGDNRLLSSRINIVPFSIIYNKGLLYNVNSLHVPRWWEPIEEANFKESVYGFYI